MTPWRITKDGIEILRINGKVYVHTPELGTFGFYTETARNLWEILKDKRGNKLFIKMLEAALEENDAPR